MNIAETKPRIFLNHEKIVMAVIIATAILIYGFMQMRIAEETRYQYHYTHTENFGKDHIVRWVFDRRTGKVYLIPTVSSDTGKVRTFVFDPVHHRNLRVLWNVDATEEE